VVTETSESASRALALGDRYWDALLRLNPIWATQVGDDRFDDRLPTLGISARTDELTTYRDALRDATSLHRQDLKPVERTTLDVVESHARGQTERIELGYDLLDAVDHIWGPGTLLGRLLQVQPLDTAEDLNRFRARLMGVPDYLDGAIALLREGISSGYVASRIVVDRTIDQVDRLLEQAPGEFDAVQAVPLTEREQTADIIAHRVLPAYARYRQALAAYRWHARDSIGLAALPHGAEMYASRVQAWTSLSAAPTDVHATGLALLESIRLEQERIARRLGHASIEDVKRNARERTQAPSREDIVTAANRVVTRGWEASKQWFGRLPRANCIVRPIDLSRENDVLDHYIQPTEDGSRPGTYYVSTRPGRSLYRLATTVFHESSPGHHLQVTLEQEAVDRPRILRNTADLVGGGFCEGWGLYAERLADDMGLFDDEYERMGMLELQALRAARLVVDTGIHALGWDRERAIAVLEEAWADNRADAEIEVDRYIALPGQALCYTLGQREIFRWRNEASERLGAAFDLKSFHDRLLEIGSLPLPSIERELVSSSSAEEDRP